LLGSIGAIGSFLMTPLYFVTSAILVGFHAAFATVLGANSNWAWVLSIIGLTVFIRVLLIPLFVKQIKNSRNMQMLQPKMKELQKKYGKDRERLAQETMKLYKETGTNPFASCLPLLLQAPIFIALFRTLNDAVHNEPKGIMTVAQVKGLANAHIFGAKISDTFTGAHSLHVQILTMVLVVVMTGTTFTTQRQLMRKNMPESALSGQYAQQQKMLLYVLPLVFAVGGIAFPLGVLLYWTTSNLWTMGQQFYVIRNNPAPGTPAFDAKVQRDAKRASRHAKTGDPVPGTVVGTELSANGLSGSGSNGATATSAEGRRAPNGASRASGSRPGGGQPSRNQPKKVPRSKRRTPGG
jgi:YidC/Oxa1 family membrane protein insertase